MWMQTRQCLQTAVSSVTRIRYLLQVKIQDSIFSIAMLRELQILYSVHLRRYFKTAPSGQKQIHSSLPPVPPRGKSLVMCSSTARSLPIAPLPNWRLEGHGGPMQKLHSFVA